jgi:hypothetical protein
MNQPLPTFVMAVGMVGLLQGQATPPPAVAVEPITAIIDAFRTHSIVALGDNHRNRQCHDFRLALIRDPRFASAVNDIVVEFGSAKYQERMDKYIHGEAVPHEELRQAWQNTTQLEYEWDLPIYQEFFRAVRGVNASLPRERQIRVLLGDPPVDWDNVRTIADLRGPLAQRDTHAVELIRREVLAKNRRALVIYGDQHLVRKNVVAGAADEWAPGIVAQLEKAGITKVFTIHPETRMDLTALQPDVASWPKPSLAVLKGTLLGAVDFSSAPRQKQVRMQEQFDAFLYLGPPSAMTMAQLSHSLCTDRAYMEMRLWRLSLLPPPGGAPYNPVDQLKQYCALPEGDTEIPDREPKTTAFVSEMLRDAAIGKVDSNRIAPESRDRLVPFLQSNGPRVLGPLGALKSLTLLAEINDAGKRIRRYRAIFASGQKMMWTVGFSPEGAILSLDPQRE